MIPVQLSAVLTLDGDLVQVTKIGFNLKTADMIFSHLSLDESSSLLLDDSESPMSPKSVKLPAPPPPPPLKTPAAAAAEAAAAVVLVLAPPLPFLGCLLN